MVRPLKYLRNVLLFLASLIFAVLVLLYFAPGPLIRPLANTYLKTIGFPIEQVSDAKFTFNESRVAELTISNEQNTFVLHNLMLDYRFLELLRGNVDSLYIEGITLLIEPGPELESEPTNSSLIGMVDLAKQMPLANITVGMLNLNDEILLRNLGFSRSIQEFTAAFDYQDFSLSAKGDWFDSSQLKGNVALSQNSNILINTVYQIALAEHSVDWQGQSQVSLSNLQNVPALADIFTPHQLTNSSIAVSTEALVEEIFLEPLVSHFSATLSNPENSDIAISTQLEAGELFSSISLPLSITGTATDLTSAINFNVSSFVNNFSWQSESLTANGSLSLDSISGSCTVSLDCLSNQQIQLTVDELTADELSQLQVSVQADTTVSRSGNSLSLNLNEPTQAAVTNLALDALSVASINWKNLNGGWAEYDLDTSAMSLVIPVSQIKVEDLQSSFALSQLTLELQELNLNLVESFSSNVDFSSVEFVPGLESIIPVSPGFAGSLALQDNVVDLNMTLMLKNRDLLHSQLSHDLDSGTGSASIELPGLIFSNITPLSSYFEELPVTADLVSGIISSQTQLDWQITDTGEIQLSGPLELSIDDLGGFYNDIVFVGFQNDTQAQINSLSEISAYQFAEASLETLDIGTSINNLRWQYQFNSAELAVTVQDFYAELLGGSVSFDEFDYQYQRAQNHLTIAVDGIQLNDVSALAEYPDLYVDGSISGSIPVVITPQYVTVDQGTIVALNPGVIRYTPANPTPNPNPTMQLVNDALSNYHYNTLDSDVIYDENGDLNLAVKLQGNNPDMNAGQAINLNVNIFDNIPTMLRSLQASRVITDTLEQSLQDRQQPQNNQQIQ